MKISRALRHVLLSALLGTAVLASAQPDAELASLIGKAEKGNAIAQYNLGLTYAEGRGVPVDPVEAYVWLSLAQENGARGRALEILLLRMGPGQVEIARARLDKRRAALGLHATPVTSAAPAVTETKGTPAPAMATVATPDTAATERELAQARLDKQQLSNELAAAWKETDQLKAELERARATGTETEQVRRERDALNTRLETLGAELTGLRSDRDRLQRAAAEAEQRAGTVQEAARAGETRIAELLRQTEQLRTELATARATPAAEAAPAENPELTRRTRELQTAQAELEQARRTQTATAVALQQIRAERTSLKSQLTQAQTAALDLGQQVDALNKRVAELSARPEAPAYPDLRERVSDLEAQVAALRDAPPAFPDLRGRVSELEAQLASASTAPARPAAPAYPDLRDRVSELENQLGAAREQSSGLGIRADALAKARASVESELQTVRTQLTRSQQQAGTAADELLRARTTVRELETALAATRTEAQRAAAAAPAYPDLRERVADLEAQVAALRDAGPAFPDLRGRVAELEQQLAANTNARPTTPAYPDLRGRVSELEAQVAALRDAPPAYPDLRGRVGDLEMQLASANSRPAAPAYPDLRTRVAALESELAAARAAAPAYPDLRARVTELEHQLAVTQGPAPEPAAGTGELAQQLADTEGKLATALRGYSLLQKEHDDLRARLEQDGAQVATERDALAGRLATAEEEARNAQAEVARLTESLGALQRSTGTASSDLAAARALVQQLQGANTVLARENYDLKAQVAREPARPVAAGPAVPAGRTHTVADGDSLSRISQRYYGTPARWPEIFNANRDVVDAQGTLRVGMVLRIP